MQKQYVRKVQKIGNGLGLRVPPELCQEAEVGRGDNIALEFNPESGGLKLGKVALANPVVDDVPPQDETLENSESKSNENKSRVDLAGETEQNPQPDVSKFEFCTSCGSDDIQVTGNQFYCGECDVTYEVTPRGTKVVAANPMQIVNDLENRVEQLEHSVDGLNHKSGNDENSGGLLSWLGIRWSDGNDGNGDEGLVPVGAGSDEDEDEDEDEETELGGFISW